MTLAGTGGRLEFHVMPLLTTLALCLALGTPQDTPKPEKTKTYKEAEADLLFDYPASWQLRKDKYASIFEFSVNNQQVQIRILKTAGRYPASHWQESVKMVEETKGSEVLQQWEEDLLGVPLLMSKFREQSGAQKSIVLVGMLYTKTVQKVSFRVISPESVAEEAEKAWRGALVTIRTVSGDLPVKEDPSSTAPVPTTEVKPATGPTKTVVIKAKNGREGKVFQGPVRAEADKDRGLYAYLPEGWQLSDGILKGGAGMPSFKFSVGISELDASKREWLIRAGKLMSDLDSVSNRDEPPVKQSSAGFDLYTMVRVGKKADQEVVQILTLGWAGGLYWIAEQQIQKDMWMSRSKDVMSTFDKISVASS